MRVLLIDGEYYRKLYSVEKLQEIINSFIGVVNYPDKIIYYSTCINSIREELYKIKNLEVNDKGYISEPCKGTKVQKAVDGYIIKDLILFSQEPNVTDIYLVAGDGDLIPGIEYAKEKRKSIKVISCVKNTSEKIKRLVEVFDFKEYLNLTTETEVTNEVPLSDNVLKLKKMWSDKKDNNKWLSSTTIGQNKKHYNFTYTKGKLKDLLNQLEKDSVIELQEDSVSTGSKIRFLNVS